MSRIRESFVARFGEDAAQAIEEAAHDHEVEANPYDVLGTDHKDHKGNDHFQWAIMMVLSYECVSKPEYREWHGINIEWEDFDEWVKLEGDLTSFEGEFDKMALIIGVYQPYLEVGQ
jgi:hypothetical protein